MKLLALSFPRHDGSISYFDGEEVRYIKLERLKQEKRYHYYNRWEWIRDIKQWWGVDISEIDEIVIDFHTENAYGIENIPSEIKRVLSGEVNTVKLTRDINPFADYFHHDNMWFIGHHYAHSLSSWMLTDKTSDVDIVIDGIGDFRTWSVFKNGKLVASGNPNNGSFGGETAQAGYWLNVKAANGNDVAGKVMGIQSYGNIDEDYLNYLRQFNYDKISEIFSRDHWFNFKTDELLGSLMPINWIRTVHERCGEVLVNLFSDFANPDDLITYSGGVAQNVVWNTVIREKFPNLIIPPHSSDEGLSLGGLEWLRRKNNLPKFSNKNYPYWQSDIAPEETPTEETIKYAAQLLSEGKIIAWYQGHGEVGPRALGNRSILMNPSIENGKYIINTVKNRENYRPFGASILYEYVDDYFDMKYHDPYMLYVSDMKVSGFEAIRHVDNTCRVQTIKDENPCYRQLIQEFYNLTGCPILLNTSLNKAGLPIAGYPEITIDIFNNTPIDVIFMGNRIIHK